MVYMSSSRDLRFRVPDYLDLGESVGEMSDDEFWAEMSQVVFYARPDSPLLVGGPAILPPEGGEV